MMTTIFRTALCVAVLLAPVTAGAQGPTCGSVAPLERLRWHVPKVEHYDDGDRKNFCETTILVTNLDRQAAIVQVDFQR